MKTYTHASHKGALGIALAACTFTVWPAIAAADPNGEAAAVKAYVAGSTSLFGLISPSISAALADTGPLTGGDDAEQASKLSGVIPTLVGAETLHAVTYSANDTVNSESSLSNIDLSVAGNTLQVGFVMAQAFAPTSGAAPSGVSRIDGLVVNGTPVIVTGALNQTVAIPGGQLVLNEQQATASGIVVNAIHLVLNGVADIIIASANAGN